jgi:hypothetical protein
MWSWYLSDCPLCVHLLFVSELEFLDILKKIMSRDSSVSITTCYGLDDRGSILTYVSITVAMYKPGIRVCQR